MECFFHSCSLLVFSCSHIKRLVSSKSNNVNAVIDGSKLAQTSIYFLEILLPLKNSFS